MVWRTQTHTQTRERAPKQQTLDCECNCGSEEISFFHFFPPLIRCLCMLARFTDAKVSRHFCTFQSDKLILLVSNRNLFVRLRKVRKWMAHFHGRMFLPNLDKSNNENCIGSVKHVLCDRRLSFNANQQTNKGSQWVQSAEDLCRSVKVNRLVKLLGVAKRY